MLTLVQNFKNFGCRKKLTPLVCKMSALAQPSLPTCPCGGYTISFEQSEVFYIKKCGRPHLKTPPFSALDNPPPSDCERFLWKPLARNHLIFHPNRFLLMLFSGAERTKYIRGTESICRKILVLA